MKVYPLMFLLYKRPLNKEQLIYIFEQNPEHLLIFAAGNEGERVGGWV